MHSGLIFVLCFVALGVVTFGTRSGWWKRAYLYVRVFIRAYRDPTADRIAAKRSGDELQSLWAYAHNLASEQSDPQWVHSRTVPERTRGRSR
jgi:hypothetical protein